MNHQWETTRVGRHMTLAPLTLRADQTLAIAHQLMRAKRIRHLPVVRGGKLVGLLSQRDLMLIETLPDVDPATVPVEDAMTTEVFAVSPDASLATVARKMESAAWVRWSSWRGSAWWGCSRPPTPAGPWRGCFRRQHRGRRGPGLRVDSRTLRVGGTSCAVGRREAGP